MHVLVVDDHSIVANAFTEIVRQLRGAWQTVVATSGQDALNKLALHDDIQFAIVDVFLPDTYGLALATKILDQKPAINIIVISASEDADVVHESKKLGFKGYIMKSLSPSEIASALETIFDGNEHFPNVEALHVNRQQENNLQQTKKNNDIKKTLESLTKRQKQILRLLGNGRSNKDIANELFISMSTVKVHVSTIFKVLNVENRAQAAIMAKNLFDI